MDSLKKSEHLSTGEKGETIAEEYLRHLDYMILDKNWSFRHKELDLIALEGDELVVVEVKTRTEPVIDNPHLSVNRKKQRNIISAANAYIRFNRISFDVRFDIIWIRIDVSGRAQIEHIKNAFIPLL